MDEIRVRYIVDQKAAVLAGQKFFGAVETTVDPAALTEEQRQELSQQCGIDRGVFELNRYQSDVGDLTLGTRDDAHIVTLLDARIQVRREKEAQKQKERDETSARCAALLAGPARVEILEKIVRGQKIRYVFPDSIQNAEEWWADHQAEFIVEMDIIRIRDERKKREQDAETACIVAERAAQVLAAGVEGLLKNDGGTWVHTEYIGGASLSTWQERNASDVVNLIAQANAEAGRRNDAEKQARIDLIDAWVAGKGTENQKGRHALGLLPQDEVLDAMRDEVFEALESFPRYEKIKKKDLEHAEYCDIRGITCDVSDAAALTAEQYDQFAAIQKAAPQGAHSAALEHECECSECDAKLTRTSARVGVTIGAFTFTREYAL